MRTNRAKGVLRKVSTELTQAELIQLQRYAATRKSSIASLIARWIRSALAKAG